MLSVIYVVADLADLLFDGLIKVICELEVVGFFAESYYFFSKCYAAFAALCPYFGKSNVYSQFLALLFNKVEFCLGICRECIDGYYAGKSVNVLYVGYVLKEVGKSCFESFQILFVKLILGNSAVILESSYCSYDNCCGRLESCHSALDVNELLSAQISSETCFCYSVVSKLKSHLRSCYGVAAVSDVSERTAVDKCGCSFKGLYKVRLESILKKCRHSAFSLKVMSCNGLSIIGVSYDDLGKSFLQVGDILSQAKDSHYF